LNRRAESRANFARDRASVKPVVLSLLQRQTLVPLHVLGSDWKFDAALPTFETMESARHRTIADSPRPLISESVVDAPAGDVPTRVRAARWTSDDPDRALIAARTVRTTLIVNLLDAEPILPLQLAWAMQNLEKLAIGIDAVVGGFSIARVRVCVYRSVAPAVMVQLKTLCSQRPIDCDLLQLPPRYPVAMARLLKHQVDRRDRSAVVLDAVSIIELAHQAREGSVPNLVPVALHDLPANQSHFRLVPRGTTLSRLLDHLQLSHHRSTLRAGASLRDVRIDASHKIDQGELTFHLHPPAATGNADPCTRCGWCAEICPTRLSPADLFDAAHSRDASSRLATLGVSSCIDCGLCTAICPSQLPLHLSFSPERA
jgi:ferredoxin